MVWRQGALKIYRTLLLAYPAEFRDEYAEEMERLFAERLAAEPPMGPCMAALADVAIAAPREHLTFLRAICATAFVYSPKRPALCARRCSPSHSA